MGAERLSNRPRGLGFGTVLTPAVALVMALALALATAIPGVSGVWVYHMGRPASQVGYARVALMPFEYSPDQVLPTDSANAGNHLDVVRSIVDNPVGGLNASSLTNWIVPNNLDRFGGVLYDRQAITVAGVSAKNLLEMFTSSASTGVSFVIERVSDSELAVYTMSRALVDNGHAGDVVKGYRTRIVKSGGQWKAVGSTKGWTTLKTVTVGAGVGFLSFDPRNGEWHKGDPPSAGA